MIAINSCPVCDSNRIIPFRQGFAPHVNYEVMPGVQVRAAIITCYSVCQNCNVIFQNPRFSDSELKIFYSGDYYRKTINLTEEEMGRDEQYRAKADAEIIKQHVGKVIAHLDIGGSRGYLLGAVGADVRVNVEPNTSYSGVKGIEVYPEIKKVPRKTFDLVTAIHVLEHVPDPMDYLKEMIKLVDKNGHLVIEVPTWKSPGGPLRLAHLYHFEPDVLRWMCREVGLNVLETKFTPHLLLICKLDQKI